MTTGSTERSIDADLAWCHESVHAVSRTFSITVARLETPTADHICLGYLLCRIADTVEDAGHIPPAEKAHLLRRYGRVLDRDDDLDATALVEEFEPWIPDRRSAEWDVVAATPRVVSTFEAMDAGAREIVREPVCELVDGMAMFTERYASEGGLRLKTLEELEEYCWYAAGTVGSLITGLVSRDTSPDTARELRRNARSFALLLQLVNVAKDVEGDYREENNVYLPDEWLRAEDVDPERICAAENVGGVARVIRRVTDHAEQYLDDAQRYLEVVPERRGNRLSAWAIPYLLAVGTIRELRSRPEDVLVEGNVKVSREEVYELVRHFERGVSRSTIADLRAEMAAKPLHH